MKPENRPAVVVAVVSTTALVYLLDSDENGKEITWQEFRHDYLAKGLVRSRMSSSFSWRIILAHVGREAGSHGQIHSPRLRQGFLRVNIENHKIRFIASFSGIETCASVLHHRERGDLRAQS